jgi:alginate O-acetyltransferase complex protein AlgI
LTGPTLAAAAVFLGLFLGARRPGGRRAILLTAIVILGLLLSLGHVQARRLAALLFVCSIFLTWLVFLAATAPGNRPRICRGAIALLVLLFIGLKWAGAQRAVYTWLGLPERYLLSLGAWLGASYILFRLLHVLIEAERGGLPNFSFPDLFLYVLFPPTLLAGPIDRFPRFRNDAVFGRPSGSDIGEGIRRIIVGVFKKFVIADFLATLPLDFPHAGLSTLRLWASLYLFGFQIYFDFAGYSDLAIGSARLLGFSIPENFNWPYVKQNLTKFWQSWHATLSGWMRDYVFFPMGRALRRNLAFLPEPPAVLLCFLTTMVLIGLWHGFEGRYALWGVWHGTGLFLARSWAGTRRGRVPVRLPRLRQLGATALTFQFVMTGWVFFYAGNVRESLTVLARLAG